MGCHSGSSYLSTFVCPVLHCFCGLRGSQALTFLAILGAQKWGRLGANAKPSPRVLCRLTVLLLILFEVVLTSPGLALRILLGAALAALFVLLILLLVLAGLVWLVRLLACLFFVVHDLKLLSVHHTDQKCFGRSHD
jgi:hypothetical protein